MNVQLHRVSTVLKMVPCGEQQEGKCTYITYFVLKHVKWGFEPFV